MHIKQINENTVLFFDNSLEDIRKFYNMKRISISKYLNSIYKFYCNESSTNESSLATWKIRRVLLVGHIVYDRLVKLSLFSTLLEKSPLTSIYFATFEKKREVRSPLPTQSKFLVFGK